MAAPTERNRRWGGGAGPEKIEKSIERSIRKVGTSGDVSIKRSVHVISGKQENVKYMGPSKLGSKTSKKGGGKSQSKKHVSAGRGQ